MDELLTHISEKGINVKAAEEDEKPSLKESFYGCVFVKRDMTNHKGFRDKALSILLVFG